MENSEKNSTTRRLQDAIGIKYPNRKMNMDRRVTIGDRRVHNDIHYKGPARRVSLEARSPLDRRDQRSAVSA